MNIQFFDPQDVPQPKENIKIEHLSASLYPDRWRIKVNINVTPFMVRPNLVVVLLRDLPADQPPQAVGDMTIIETMHAKMEFTLHIRGVSDPQGDYRLKARLYFEEGVQKPYDEAQFSLSIPAAKDMPEEEN